MNSCPTFWRERLSFGLMGVRSSYAPAKCSPFHQTWHTRPKLSKIPWTSTSSIHPAPTGCEERIAICEVNSRKTSSWKGLLGIFAALELRTVMCGEHLGQSATIDFVLVIAHRSSSGPKQLRTRDSSSKAVFRKGVATSASTKVSPDYIPCRAGNPGFRHCPRRNGDVAWQRRQYRLSG